MAAIETVVRAEAPDVLCLQEVWGNGGDSSAARLAEALGFQFALTDDPFADRRAASPNPESSGFHNAILSRWPLRQPVSHPLPRLDGSDGHRRALSVAVEVPGGSWTVVSTHLDHRFDESAVRRLQCTALLRVVDSLRGDPAIDVPVIVAGDFNAVPDSDEIRMLTGRATVPVSNLVLSDCWEHVGEGAGHTWRSDNPYQASTAWPNRRLDYVFVSWPRPKPIGNPVAAHLAGLTAVAGIHPSDHAAVVVDLIST